MEPEALERIRSASFNLERRGYDRAEVDLFLSQLADWLEGLDEESSESEAVQRELERIAERTAKVLTSAGEAGAALRQDAQQRATAMVEEARVQSNALRVDADTYTERVMADADDYMQTTRGKADAYSAEKHSTAEAVEQEATARAEQTVSERLEEARAEADAMVREGRERREDLEHVIADLTTRRDKLLDEMESIAGTLTGTASQHRGRREEIRTEAFDVSPENDPDGYDGSGETQTLDVLDDSTDEVPTAERSPAPKPSKTDPA